LAAKRIRTGQASAGAAVAKGEILDQLNHEVTHLAKDLNTARAVAEEEARLRDSNASIWTAERLRVSLRNKLQEKPLFVVRIASRTCTCSAERMSDPNDCAGKRGGDRA